MLRLYLLDEELLQDENVELLKRGCCADAGKTTVLRDVAGLLADRFKQRVIVVDTSCEIAWDGALAHPCIGRAWQMMVPAHERQHEMLREAVQNHNPRVAPAGAIPVLT